jgi:hypothetical protein
MGHCQNVVTQRFDQFPPIRRAQSDRHRYDPAARQKSLVPLPATVTCPRLDGIHLSSHSVLGACLNRAPHPHPFLSSRYPFLIEPITGRPWRASGNARNPACQLPKGAPTMTTLRCSMDPDKPVRLDSLGGCICIMIASIVVTLSVGRGPGLFTYPLLKNFLVKARVVPGGRSSREFEYERPCTSL